MTDHPRLAALFVSDLGRLLREHLGLALAAAAADDPAPLTLETATGSPVTVAGGYDADDELYLFVESAGGAYLSPGQVVALIRHLTVVVDAAPRRAGAGS